MHIKSNSQFAGTYFKDLNEAIYEILVICDIKLSALNAQNDSTRSKPFLHLTYLRGVSF